MKPFETWLSPFVRGLIAATVLLCALPALARSAGALPTHAPPASQGEQLAVDDEFQEAIAKVVQAEKREVRRAALDSLDRLAGDDPEGLVLQLFVYAEWARTTRDAMAFATVVRALRVSDGAIQRALVPLLESPDAALRRTVAGYLSEFEHRSTDHPTNLSVYRPFLEKSVRGEEATPAGLVRYLFDADAGSALLLFARLHALSRADLREVLWAEHEVRTWLWKVRNGFSEPSEAGPDVRAELAKLARHDQWWARLYAAAVIADFRVADGAGRGLGMAEELEELARDSHALVSERAQRASARGR